MNLYSALSFFIAFYEPRYCVLVIFLLILLFLILKRNVQAQRECWLSSRIKDVKKKLRGENSLEQDYEIFCDRLSQSYYPTWPRLFILVGTLTAIFVFFINSSWLVSNSSYQGLSSIQIGVVALIFPIMIFIIGFSGNKTAYGANLSEVLLRESYLFPVGIIALFFSVDLIWARSTPIVIFQIIFTAIMYAAVLFQVIRLLLSDQKLLKKSEALLKDKMRRAIENTIENRLGNNILFEHLGENRIELEYTMPGFEKRGEEYVQFNLKQRGEISDINLVNLDKIAKIVEKSCRQFGFSFYKDIPNPAVIDNTLDTSAERDSLTENKERFILKRFMEVVTDGSGCILSINKKLLPDKSIQSQVESIVSKTFRFKKHEEDILSVELSNLKDQFIDDIRSKRLGRIDRLKSIYIALGELFLDILKDYSSNYSMELARKERGNIYSVNNWDEVEGIFGDLRDIYEVAVESRDKNMVREVGYLPIALANRALRSSDHFIFQKGFSFLRFFYMHANLIQNKDMELSDFIKERVGIYLRETADYSIQFELSKIGLGENKVQQYKDFAIEIYLQLQGLLKQAYDGKDFKFFESYLAIGHSLFSDFQPSQDYPDVENLRWQLQVSNLDESIKDKLRREIKQKEFLIKIESEINNKRSEMFFGLASLILSDYDKNKSDTALLKYFHAINARLPSGLIELTQVFLNAYANDAAHFWGWDWWGVSSDGAVYTMDFMSKTALLYSLKSLEIASKTSEAQLLREELPTSRDFMSMVENEDSILKKTISDIVSEIGQWSEIVDAGIISQKNVLFKMFDKAKEQQIHKDEDILIAAEISEARKFEFVDAFLESYRNNNTLHRIFDKYSILNVDLDNIARPPEAVGYNQLDEKAAFVDNWHVHYSRWGQQYGNGMATSENNSIFTEMCKGSTAREIEKVDILHQIESVSNELIKSGYSPNLIIASLEFEDLRRLTESGKFIPYWHKDFNKKNNIPNFQGNLKLKHATIPVFKIFKMTKGFIGVFDLKKFAVLSQFNPLAQLTEKDLYNIFKIEVIDLNKDEALRKDILSKNPEWLNKYPDKDRFLRTKVVIKAFMRQELKVIDEKAAIILKIKANVK